MEDFETIVRSVVDERRRNEYNEDLENYQNGEYEYTKFKCWCNAFKNGKGQDNPKVFAEYLKSVGSELGFWAKKHLAEKYFDYEYDYDHNTGEWNIHRKKNDILERIDEKDKTVYNLNKGDNNG